MAASSIQRPCMVETRSQAKNSDLSIMSETRILNAIDEIKSDFQSEFQSMKAEIRDLREILEARDDQITFQSNEIKQLKEDASILRATVQKLEYKIDSTEQYERKDCIIISGNIPSFQTGEITRDVVIQVIRSKLSINILPMDINVAHRLQSSNTRGQSAKPPNIYVKLCRRDLKKDIIVASKQQPRATESERNQKIFINES